MDSYAQLALAKSAHKGVASRAVSSRSGAEPGSVAALEDKVLNLAMLLRTAQTCHDDADASHRSHILELSARMKQLEELVQRQLVASAPVSAAADAYTVRAVAERLTLLEQHLSEGLSANHSAHTQNSEVFGALEARLASLESAPAARAKESTANVVAPVKAACLDAVEGRLNRFECEVQARLLLATAGETPAQRAVEQQQQQQQAEQQQAEQQRQLDAALARFQELLAYSIDGLAVGSSSGGAVPAAPLDARAVEALVDARMEVALAGMRGELADVGAEVEELRGEAAGAVTRRQMLQLLAQLRALSGVHASMRGAIGALAAAAPRLRQSVAVPGNGGGAGSGGAAAGQAALAEHVEALAAVLSRQLDHAVELATGAVGASVDAAGEDADDGAAGGGSGGADVALQVPQPRPRGRAPVPARASAHAPLHLREPVEEPLLSPTGQGGHLDAEQSGQQQQRAVAGARDAGRPRAAAAAEHAAVGGRPQAQAAAHQQAAGRQRAAGHEAAVGGQSPTQAAAVAEQALELERCGVRPGALAAQPAQVQDVQERSQAAIHHKQVALKQLVRELARELQPIMRCGGTDMSAPVFKPTCLAQAIAYGEEVFSHVLDKARSACAPSSDAPRPPASWSDALAIVQAREDAERRKKDVKKDKSKGGRSSVLAGDPSIYPPPPGTHIGLVSEQSVFWLFMEDYFRDLSSEDFHLLLPRVLDASQDDALTVPFLGRERENGSEKLGRGARRDELEAKPQHVTDVSSSDALLSSLPTESLSAMAALMRKLGLVGGLRDGVLGADPSGSVHRPLPVLVDEKRAPSSESRAQLEAVVKKVAGSELARACADAPAPGPAWRARLLHGHPREAELLRAAAEEDRASSRGGSAGGAGSSEGGDSRRGTGGGSEGGDSRRGGGARGGGGAASTSGGSAPTSGGGAAPGASGAAAHAGVDYLDRTTIPAGDYVHPFTRLLLARAPTAYMLDPRAQHLSASGERDEEGGEAHGGGQGDGDACTPAPGLQLTPAPVAGWGGARKKGCTVAGGPSSKRGASSNSTQPSAAPTPCASVAVGCAATPSGAAGGADDSGAGVDVDTAGTSAGGGGDGGGTRGTRGSARLSSFTNYSLLSGKQRDKTPAVMAATAAAAAAAAAVGVAGGEGGGGEGRGGGGRKKGGRGGRGGRGGGGGAGSKAAGAAAAAAAAYAPALALFARAGGDETLEDELASANPVIADVARCIARGHTDGDAEQQWAMLEEGAELLSAAPDDEVLAELLAVQSELVQQMAINRHRAAGFLLRALEDVPRQATVCEERARLEDDIRAYWQHRAETKRNQKREAREMQKKQALAALNASPGPGLRGTAAMEALAIGAQFVAVPGQPFVLPPELAAEMVDPVTMRKDDEEAVCAICADGESVEPNQILFCERCDVSVHQHCYGVPEIPDGEWLCWPCWAYENNQLNAGRPQNEVRPPRWEMAAQGLTAGSLPGGSTAATCCLCPVRHGAFKTMTDTGEWCHVVCGLWHPDTAVLPGNVCAAVLNKAAIKHDKWDVPCGVCQLSHGAVVKCNYGHCQTVFHPLCARRAGLYVPAKVGAGGKLAFRSYCLQHSDVHSDVVGVAFGVA
ncbi:hypothetical protein FOA52_000522 [Chlamydomonas sp. UWO 241]|nr:hypothetical protein FOA52_000522 [Chlamydomonas sp. UWO 241]